MKIEFIDNWQQAYKFWSMWVMAVIAMLPEIYDALLQFGILEGTSIPEFYKRLTQIIAVVGVIARIVKQNAPQMTDVGNISPDTPSQ